MDLIKMESPGTFYEYRQYISNLETNEVFLQRFQWWLLTFQSFDAMDSATLGVSAYDLYAFFLF